MDQKDFEFYKQYQIDKPSKVKSFITFGGSYYESIKQMPVEVQNFLLDNSNKIKALGFEKFKLLVDNYGLYNIKDVIIKSNEEELKTLSKEPDLLKHMDEIVKEDLKSLKFVSLAASPRIKTLFPDLFNSSIYKENPELINKIFSSENTKLSFLESINLIKSGINISSLPVTIFNDNIKNFMMNMGDSKIYDVLKITPDDKLADFFNLNFSDKKIQNLLNTLNVNQTQEILNSMPGLLINKYFNQYDLNKGYQLNMWTCLRDNNELEKNPSVTEHLLSSFNIRTSFEVMKRSSLYNGIPINISDYITAEQYNREVDISEQKDITFEGFRELFNHFDESNVKKIIETVAKRNDMGDGILKCNDKSNKLDLMSCIKNGNYDKIPELLDGFLINVSNSMWGRYQSSAKDNILVKALTENRILPIELDKKYIDSIIYGDYATICEWLKKMNPDEKLYLSFVGVFPVQEARNVLDKKPIFDSILNHKIFEGQKGNFDFQVSLTSAMLVFDVFNNPSNVDELIECYSSIGNNNFMLLFKKLSMRLNPEFLKDIRANYQQLALNSNPYGKEYDRKEKLKRILGDIDKHEFKSVGEILNYLDFGYKNVHPNCAFAAHQMKEKKVSEEYYSYYLKLYEMAIKRNGLTIPCVDGETEYFSFQSVRLWDERLLNFDLETGAKISQKAKDRLFLGNDCRLIEIKDKNKKVVDQIYVQIDSEHNVTLVSLMKIGDEFFQNKMYESIITELKKEYSQKGVNANFNISNQINEEINKDINLESFDEPPKVIELKGSILSCNENYESDAVKIANINEIAFGSSKNGIRLGEVMRSQGAKTNYFVGRDWFLSLDDYSDRKDLDPYKKIHFIARYTHDNSRMGSNEMTKCVVDITEKSNAPVTVDSYPSSYYLFAKLAASGQIFILKDEYMVERDRTHAVISSYLLDDGNVNLDFDSKLGFNGYKTSDEGKVANVMSFISSKNISKEQQEKIEIQKVLYSKIVEKLEKKRKQSKHENWAPEAYADIYEREYSELEEREELAHVTNLRTYSTAYLNYVLVKGELSSNLRFYNDADIERRIY